MTSPAVSKVSKSQIRLIRCTRSLANYDDQRQQRGRVPGGLDLTPYMDMIDTIRAEGGVGGQVILEEGESQRAALPLLGIDL